MQHAHCQGLAKTARTRNQGNLWPVLAEEFLQERCLVDVGVVPFAKFPEGLSANENARAEHGSAPVVKCCLGLAHAIWLHASRQQRSRYCFRRGLGTGPTAAKDWRPLLQRQAMPPAPPAGEAGELDAREGVPASGHRRGKGAGRLLPQAAGLAFANPGEPAPKAIEQEAVKPPRRLVEQLLRHAP